MTQGAEMSTDSDSASSTCTSPVETLSTWTLVDKSVTPFESLKSVSPLTDPDEQCHERGHSKLKKRVSFPLTDEELVSIREIPSRDEIPLEEELVPCDPEKLIEEMEAVAKVESPRRYECSNKNSGRSLSIVAEITGTNVYGSEFSSRSISKQAAKQFSQSLRKAKESIEQKYEDKPTRQKKVSVKQFLTDDISDKLRVAPVKDRNSRGSRRASAKKDRDKPKKQKSPTGNSGDSGNKHRTKVITFEPVSHKTELKAQKSRTKKPPKPVEASNASEPLVLPEVFANRILTSPCKHGIIPEARQRPFSTPSYGHVETSSGFIFPNDTSHALRVKSAGHQPREVTIEKRSLTKAKQKIYAWNMANGAAMETTPCIAPMWDIPCAKLAQNVDYLKIS